MGRRLWHQETVRILPEGAPRLTVCHKETGADDYTLPNAHVLRDTSPPVERLTDDHQGIKDLQPAECYSWFADVLSTRNPESGHKTRSLFIAYRGEIRKVCELCCSGGEVDDDDE